MSSIRGNYLEVQDCIHMLGHPRLTTWLVPMLGERKRKEEEVGEGAENLYPDRPGLCTPAIFTRAGDVGLLRLCLSPSSCA